MIYELCCMICDLEGRNGSGPAGQSCLARRGNPRFVIGHGVYVRKAQTASSGWCGVLVFWADVPRKRGFGDAGALCIWHVARGGLYFWGKNEGGHVPCCGTLTIFAGPPRTSPECVARFRRGHGGTGLISWGRKSIFGQDKNVYEKRSSYTF